MTHASFRVTYAFSLYSASVTTLGPRAAYKRACELAGLTTAAERAALRTTLYAR